MVAPPRYAEETEKRDSRSADGLSSSKPIDLVKDSCQLEESGSSKAECCRSGNRGKEHVRFGPLELHKMYHALTVDQQEVIRKMGLEGVEWTNKLVHTDLNHSAWLMLNVMPEDRALRIGVSNCDIVHITEAAVANITGNRMGGSYTVTVSEGVPMASEIKTVRSILKLPDVTEEITVSELVALLLVETKKVRKLNDDDAARTQRAFAMLYLFIALGPGEKQTRINRSSYMMVMMHADLTDVNWGKYAIDEIITGARKLNRDNPLLNITLHGCPVILEVTK